MKAINTLLPVVLSAILLTGCYQSVNLRDIQDAATICGGLDKVTEIHSHLEGSEYVKCNTRLLHKISNDNLERIAK